MTAAPTPLDASAREAAKHTAVEDAALPGDEFVFRTRGLSDTEKAAVVAVLTQAHAEERRRLRRVERRPLQPWQRSQRLPERIPVPYDAE